MVNNDSSIPFGLHFAEPATSEATPPVPEYDEETDVSYIEDFEGHKIPFVDLRVASGTQTFTEVRSEGTDEDASPQVSMAGTNTITKTVESTDEDQDKFSFMGTMTSTKERQEDTDADPNKFSLMATDTNATKAMIDTADAD